ncbi:SDR family oxidoreductase [Streptomyces sp. ISL-112]|uniref:SDR family NAD(P)-dependent oxidoreductase n=1 Tax=unclassified Streptomyces TaxID=2593676 RepID=UPI001BEAA2B1|nr:MULTISPECIES: SDR family oxidoreductase [unclassified Streptomyces]MBT2427483.1 SDR family oxidoreductase [Streptomyces sp. ISL-112]MBT2464518.1 SDR family oxidoreductase [Streptomyces sp. ISL-63]
MPLALVTGATAGIGLAFTERLARDGHDLLLVARTAKTLDRVASQVRASCHVRVRTLPADLATITGCRAVEIRIRSGPAVDILVNNAGITLPNPFLHNGLDEEEAMLDLNVRAVLRLTHAALPGMIERRSGTIVNISSFTAAGPGALSTTYPAGKAWLLSFSEALGHSRQLRAAGVRMMAVLPGFTRTELFARSRFDASQLPGWLWLEPDQVVSAALRDLERGKAVSVPSLRYKSAVWGLRHLPRPLLRPLCWDLSAPSRLWARPAVTHPGAGTEPRTPSH